MLNVVVVEGQGPHDVVEEFWCVAENGVAREREHVVGNRADSAESC